MDRADVYTQIEARDYWGKQKVMLRASPPEFVEETEVIIEIKLTEELAESTKRDPLLKTYGIKIEIIDKIIFEIDKAKFV